MSLLEARGLVKSYGGVRALDGASLDAERGRVTLLIGPNASGKTTLINAVSGTAALDAGAVTYRGEDITGLPAREVFGRGVVRTFQSPRLFAGLSALENLMVTDASSDSFRHAPARRTWAARERALAARARDALSSAGLGGMEGRLAYDLSGGQVRLLELAKVLMCSPELALLDEPVAGIAPALAGRILARIRDMSRRDGTAFLVVEHRLDIALRHADVVCVMAGGRVIARGPPEGILEDRAVEESYLGRRQA